MTTMTKANANRSRLTACSVDDVMFYSRPSSWSSGTTGPWYKQPALLSSRRPAIPDNSCTAAVPDALCSTFFDRWRWRWYSNLKARIVLKYCPPRRTA